MSAYWHKCSVVHAKGKMPLILKGKERGVHFGLAICA